MNKIYSSRYVYLFFFLYSFTFGMIFPRIGDLQIQMGIGESYLGLALSGLPIGVQIALLFADKILSLFNFKIAVSMSITILGFFLFLASFSYEPWSFFIFLVFAGIAVGVVEVAVNIPLCCKIHVCQNQPVEGRKLIADEFCPVQFVTDRVDHRPPLSHANIFCVNVQHV